VNARSSRRFSQAISEGDGISVVAHVGSADDARQAADAGADALLVRGELSLDNPQELPVLSPARLASAADADALLLELGDWDDHELMQRYGEIVDEGVECVVEVRDEEQLERVLELLDPELLLLGAYEDAEDRVDAVLDLLPDVPAGKLVIADVGLVGEDAVAGLERVGVDAVIVAVADVAALVGDEPPDV
jgi:NAD(P)H-dependent flavin oxidoreductase YrpB (nitropropane dioxygenase family)